MSNDPVPQRLSDADRDAAIAMLREHFEAGRLDQTEFSDRLEKALQTRFAAELAPLFGDLPDPRPDLGAFGYPSPFWPGPPFPSRADSTLPYPTQDPTVPFPTQDPTVPFPTSAQTPQPFPQTGPSGPPYQQPGYLVPRPDAAAPSTQPTWLPMARKLIWPVAIVLGIVTDAFMMWIVIAIIGSIVLSQLDGRTRKPPPYLGS